MAKLGLDLEYVITGKHREKQACDYSPEAFKKSIEEIAWEFHLHGIPAIEVCHVLAKLAAEMTKPCSKA